MWKEKIENILKDNFTEALRENNDLCKIMTKHGSDKGNGWHNYTQIYDKLFFNIKNDFFNIFEVGLGTNNLNIPSNMGLNGKPGASLRGWQDYFLNANIFGADVDRDIVNGPHDTHRIKTFWVDQNNEESILNMWNTINVKNKFKIIIDDGLHEYDSNINFFKNSINQLSDDGIFIIEDILKNNLNNFYIYFNEFCKNNDYYYKILSIPSPNNKDDNNLICVFKR